MAGFNQKDGRILNATKILLGLCLAAPLLASSSLLFPFTSAKSFVFRVMVEIAAAFYFYLVLKYPALRPHKTALFWAVLFFAGISLISGLAGVDPGASFWGNLERMGGVWGLMHFVAFFLMVSAVFEKGDWKKLFQFSLGVSSLIALIAVVQYFAGWGVLIPKTERVFATLGNASYLAGYLLFNVFFAVWFFCANWQKRAFRWLYGSVFLLILVALSLTGTRGAYLGLLAGGFVFLVVAALSAADKRWRWVLAGATAAAVIFIGLVFAFKNSRLVQGTYPLQRLSSISLTDTTTQNRLILWQNAWQAWQEKPILGWGPENYEIAISSKFDKRLAAFESWYDRAHNFIFDYGVASGWLGLLAYLAMPAAAFRLLWQKRREEILAVSVLAGILIAYLVQNLFVFDNFASFLMLFFILAFVNAQAGETRESKIVPLASIKKWAVAGFALLVLVSLYSFNLKPVLASRLASQILAMEPEQYQQVAPSLQQIGDLKTFASPEAAYQITLDFLDKMNLNPQMGADIQFYQVASAQLDDQIKKSPLRTKNYVALSWLDLYFSGQPGALDQALQLAQKVKDMSPTKKDGYLLLAANYALRNDLESGKTIVNQARQISPEIGDEVGRYWDSLTK